MTQVPRINDPAFVVAEYSEDSRLSARVAFWQACRGPQPVDVALQRIVEMRPGSLLEVGCGQGDLAARLASVGIDVTATDRSEHMVALTAARGVRARHADVEDLPFDDGSFDVVVAAYMLYHVADLPGALSEIVRVLGPAGRLVAVTNSVSKLHEMWELVGRDLNDGSAETFSRESGDRQLREHFDDVQRVDVDETFLVSETAMRGYIQATRFAVLADNLPGLPHGLEVTASGSVFIATK